MAGIEVHRPSHAEPLRQAFVSHEMPANFLDELHAHITAFEQAASQRTTAKSTHVEATAAIDEEIERGMTAVKAAGCHRSQ